MTLSAQIDKLKQRFQLQRVVMVSKGTEFSLKVGAEYSPVRRRVWGW
jgi:hypothetical protein